MPIDDGPRIPHISELIAKMQAEGLLNFLDAIELPPNPAKRPEVERERPATRSKGARGTKPYLDTSGANLNG